MPAGRIVALLGANGAGKTDAAGHHRPARRPRRRGHEGSLTAGGGADLLAAPRRDRAPRHRPGDGGRRIFAELTVEENLRAGAHTTAAPGEARRSSASTGCSRCSAQRGGAGRRLPVRRRAADARDRSRADGRAALPAARRAEPRAWRRKLVEQVRDLIVEINQTGSRSCWSSRTRRWRSIAAHGYVMETGKVVLDKPAAELLADEDVREFYLGLHPARAHQARSATSSTTGGGSGGR